MHSIKIQFYYMENFEFIKEIGKGSFGTVIKSKRSDTSKEVALKIENKDSKKKALLNEFDIYQIINGRDSFPDVTAFYETATRYIIEMEILGPSLETYSKNNNLNKSEIAAIFIDCIKCLRELHKLNIIHRDVKPSNFLFSCEMSSIKICDFGLSKIKENKDSLKKLKMSEHITGTPSFISIFVHLKMDARERDDMISLGYSMVSILKSLPWYKISSSTKEISKKDMMSRIFETKVKCTPEISNDLPEYYKKYFNKVSCLEQNSIPSYEKYISTISNYVDKSSVGNILCFKNINDARNKDIAEKDN